MINKICRWPKTYFFTFIIRHTIFIHQLIVLMIMTYSAVLSFYLGPNGWIFGLIIIITQIIIIAVFFKYNARKFFYYGNDYKKNFIFYEHSFWYVYELKKITHGKFSTLINTITEMNLPVLVSEDLMVRKELIDNPFFADLLLPEAVILVKDWPTQIIITFLRVS